MKYLLIFITLLIVGCGETQESYTPPTSNAIDMQLDRAYAVSEGDRVDNASSDAEVKIVQDIEGKTTQVTLVLGSAQLIRKN